MNTNTPTIQSHKGFWEKLSRPSMCMAPMADVTDAAFRSIFAKYGKPDVTWTEFVSADGLFLRPLVPGISDQPRNTLEEIALRHGIGTDHPLLKDLIYTDAERPIVAQFFSRDPERMRRAAAFARELGYDGIDINMGCPADVICQQGAGAAMIKDPVRAREIIQATILGAGDLPVSVKTRIGYNTDELDTWLPMLLTSGVAVITLHARTRKEMSKVPADWSAITRAVTMRNNLNPEVLIIGNGDVSSLAEGHARVQKTGCDGVMIGRGIFGNPWLFNERVKKEDLPIATVLEVLQEHTKLYEEILGTTKSFALMKKHFKSYLSIFPETKELRTELIENGNSYTAVQEIIARYRF